MAIDGKRMRGSYDTASEKAAIHMVSAFASQNNLCLGQVKTQDTGQTHLKNSEYFFSKFCSKGGHIPSLSF